MRKGQDRKEVFERELCRGATKGPGAGGLGMTDDVQPREPYSHAAPTPQLDYEAP